MMAVPTSFFAFWCRRCPTRVSIDSEAPTELPFIDVCPVCDGEMAPLDLLTGAAIVPYANQSAKTASELHAEWLARGALTP